LARRLTPLPAPHLAAVRVECASVRLGRHWALRDASIEVRAGQRWLLAGPNGAGKTVLLKLLRGDLWPTPTGRERRLYLVDGEWQEQPLLARERIAYLGPERQDRYDRREFDLRVDEVVATGFTHDDLPLEAPTAAQRRAVRRALQDVGLAGLAPRRFLALSHGQRRRVLLARALVGRPDLLLLDEVLNGLDAASRRAFLRALNGIRDRRMAWVLTTHRPADRPRAVTHAARIEAGQVTLARADSSGARPSRPRRARTKAASGTSAGARAQSSAGDPLLRLERVRVYRNERRVLGPLDWVVADGEHWHVAGPNGAGKSTLLALLYGDLAPAFGGRLVRRGHPPGTPVAEWKQTVGLVSPELQSRMAAVQCTAEEIVVSGLHASIGLDEPPTPRERALARRWLARVGLGGLGRRRARELSYGQLRRALVARALVRGRRLLLLDEPFDGLDAGARALVATEIAAAVRAGAQVVLATHHVEDVPAFVTRRLQLGLRRPHRRTR
jgi:molybdate transport system ATP-binding protein